MTEKEFLQITPRSFNNKLIGYRRKEERLSRESWEQTRAITVAIMRPNLKDVDRKKSISQLWSFPWDSGVKTISEDPAEAFKKSKALWAEIDEKRKAKKKSDVEQSG